MLPDQVPKLVSIGVPVYNGGKSLANALDDLSRQTYDPIEILISDNASTDSTRDICESAAQNDPRITYHRNETNIGPAANFFRVMSLARGEYFMWAAHDDHWEPRFVSANVDVLESQPEYIASVSKVQLVPASRRGEYYGGTYPLTGSVRQNVTRYLRNPALNSRFYAVMRRDPLMACFTGTEMDVWGGDWLVVVKMLKFGKYFEVEEPLFSRNNNSDNPRAAARSLKQVIGRNWKRRLPLAKFTRRVLAESHVPKTPLVLGSLLFWNACSFYAAWKARPYDSP